MNDRPRLVFSSLAVLLLAGTEARSNPPPVRFSRDILPILSQNCFQCHGPDEKARKAKLRLDNRQGALRVITPGNRAASELFRRISSDDPDERMPPAKTNRILTAAQKDLLRRWLDEGAAWGKHWAYETPVRLCPR
jgi:Planctomycete cytochrome C